jgi:hypothetical protein
VIHGVVMDAHVIRMGMIATDPIHAADMNASAEAAHVRPAVKAAEMCAAAEAADVSVSAKSTHVPAATESSAVTATTSAAAPRVGRADSQCGGKRGRGQDHHHSFHHNTPCTRGITGQRGIRTWLRDQSFAMLERVGTLDGCATKIAFTRTGVLSTRGKLRTSKIKETLG